MNEALVFLQMYYITISNGLLTQDHRKRMGSAVWEFMWLIDKVTKIDAKGTGQVLGGKPIKLAEIAKALGSDEETISRNLIRLEEQEYIKKTRTPYGIVIVVNKAKKRFNKNVESTNPRIHKDVDSNHKNVESPRKNVESNKIGQLDITDDKTNAGASPAGLASELIKLFEAVNPACKTMYGNTTQRKACEYLIAEYGFEEVSRVIAFLPKSNKIPYVPTITTPNQLWTKYQALRDALEKKKGELSSKGKGFA